MKKVKRYAQGHYISGQTGPFHFKFISFRILEIDVTLEDI